MKCQGYTLQEISNVTKHKNLDSLKHYVDGPTYEEKRGYNDALLNYAKKDSTPKNNKEKRHSSDDPQNEEEIKEKQKKIEKENTTLEVYEPNSNDATQVVPVVGQ